MSDGKTILRKRPPPRGQFLYADVARTLRKRIHDETYGSGAKLPSMSDLCAEFGVSAITVRHALRDLVQEGLLTGHQGLGVFVKPRGTIHRVLAGNLERSIGDEIARAGFAARLVELSSGDFKADEEFAKLLKVRRGTRLFRHEKMTLADEEPVALHAVVLPPDLRRLGTDLGSDFLFRVMNDHGIDLTNVRCEFSAIALNEEQARRFGLMPGFPLLRVRYTPRDANGDPLLFGETIARSDRFVFEVDLPRKAR